MADGFRIAGAALAAALAMAGGAAQGQDTAIDRFFAGLPRCHALEFSEDGYLNQLRAAFPVLSPASIDQLLAYTENYFLVPLPTDRRPYGPNEFPLRRWPVNADFRQDLATLRDLMIAEGVSGIDTVTAVAAAEVALDAQLADGGECYKISVMATASNDAESVIVVPIDAAVQRQIVAHLQSDTDALTAREEAMLAAGIVDPAEAQELRALAIATQLLEVNSFLRDDVGEYAGNWPVPGELRTTCRNEMQTYFFFLRRLERLGLLRRFDPENRYAYRYGMFDGHNGTLIRSRRTDQPFVVDSWVLDGGNPAKIMTLASWLDHGE